MKRTAPSPRNAPQAEPRTTWSDSARRTAAGIFGLLLLAVSAVLWHLAPGEDSQTWLWMSSCLRMGLILSLIWLAWPQLSRLHPWILLGSLAAVVAVLALWKGNARILPIAAVVLIVMARLRPRRGKSSAR